MDLDLIRRGMGDVGERRHWDPVEMRRRAEAEWDPGIVYEEAPDWPGAGTFTGVDEIVARFEEFSEALGEMELEVESIDDAGDDRAFVVMRAYAHSVAGVPVERRWGYLFTVKDARVTHWRAEMDPDRTRAELGLD